MRFGLANGWMTSRREKKSVFGKIATCHQLLNDGAAGEVDHHGKGREESYNNGRETFSGRPVGIPSNRRSETVHARDVPANEFRPLPYCVFTAQYVEHTYNIRVYMFVM